MTALCPYGESGCPDNEGDYDIVMPEPMSGTSGSGYKVRVMDVDDESSVDCSDDFYLLASEEAPVVGDMDGPSLVVTSPEEGDMAYAGEEYTVEVSILLFFVIVLNIRVVVVVVVVLVIFSIPRVFFSARGALSFEDRFLELEDFGRTKCNHIMHLGEHYLEIARVLFCTHEVGVNVTGTDCTVLYCQVCENGFGALPAEPNGCWRLSRVRLLRTSTWRCGLFSFVICPLRVGDSYCCVPSSIHGFTAFNSA